MVGTLENCITAYRLETEKQYATWEEKFKCQKIHMFTTFYLLFLQVVLGMEYQTLSKICPHLWKGKSAMIMVLPKPQHRCSSSLLIQNYVPSPSAHSLNSTFNRNHSCLPRTGLIIWSKARIYDNSSQIR